MRSDASRWQGRDRTRAGQLPPFIKDFCGKGGEPFCFNQRRGIAGYFRSAGYRRGPAGKRRWPPEAFQSFDKSDDLQNCSKSAFDDDCQDSLKLQNKNIHAIL